MNRTVGIAGCERAVRGRTWKVESGKRFGPDFPPVGHLLFHFKPCTEGPGPVSANVPVTYDRPLAFLNTPHLWRFEAQNQKKSLQCTLLTPGHTVHR